MPPPNKLSPKKSPKPSKKSRSLLLPGEKSRVNELKLNEKYRTELRKKKKNEIRNDCIAQLEMLETIEAEKNKRVELLKNEIVKEAQDTEVFMESVCVYYEEILKQYSLPEEKTVEDIVDDIRQELEQVFDLFHSSLHFEIRVSDEEEIMEKPHEETIFDKIEADIVVLRASISENDSKQEELIRKIAAAKIEIEQDKLMRATEVMVKDEEILLLERKREKLSELFEAAVEDPIETQKAVLLQHQISQLREENGQLEKDVLEFQQLLKNNNIK